MPIAKHNSTFVSQEPHTPDAFPEVYQTAVVQTSRSTMSELLTYSEGAPWNGVYYRQILKANESPKPQDFTQSGVYQQYDEIRNMELRLFSELQPQQDADTKRFTAIVSAAYPVIHLRPNRGDMWCTDAGGGREGVFVVTECEKKNILVNSMYELELRLVYFTDEEMARRQDLINKSVNKYVFHTELYRASEDPLISSLEYDSRLALLGAFKGLVALFYQYFYSDEVGTFVIPNQETYIYDPYVVKAVLSCMLPTDHHLYGKTRQYIQPDKYNTAPSIYDVLMQKNPGLMPLVIKKMGTVARTQFSDDLLQHTFCYSRFTYCVYPKDIRKTITASDHSPPKTTNTSTVINFGELPANNVILEPIVDAPPTPSNVVYPIITPVGIDDFYVFCHEFYEHAPTLSLLDSAVWEYLTSTNLSAAKVMAITKTVYSWNPINQFYLIPVLMILIRYITKFRD